MLVEMISKPFPKDRQIMYAKIKDFESTSFHTIALFLTRFFPNTELNVPTLQQYPPELHSQCILTELVKYIYLYKQSKMRTFLMTQQQECLQNPLIYYSNVSQLSASQNILVSLISRGLFEIFWATWTLGIDVKWI